MSHARHVDPAVISSILDLISSTFIPENAATYLFSHPLLPTIGILSSVPKQLHMKLLRLCPNVFPLNDLVQHMVDTDAPLLKMLLPQILRHSYSAIVAALRAMSPDTIDKVASVLLDTLNSPKRDVTLVAHVWELLPCVVDARGVLGLDNSVTGRLEKEVGNRVDILESQAEVAFLIEELLRRVEVDV